MPTRFYLRSTGAAAVSPAVDSLWTTTAALTRLRTSTTPQGTPANTLGATETESTTSQLLRWQYVSDPIPAQTISGTFSASIRCRETSGTMNASLQVVIRVVSNDGSTVRGTLYAGHAAANNATAGALGQEMDINGTANTETTRIIPAGTALSSVVAQANDRIVIEIGARCANTSATSFTTVLRVQDDQASDLPLTAGDSSVANPWVELSGDLFPPGSGAGSGTWTFTGAASGARASQGSGTGSWTFTGAANGTTAKSGTGTGSWAFSGAAAGATTKAGTGVGSWTFTGSAGGETAPAGDGSGSWSFTGAAAGTAPGVDDATGSGAGSWSYTGAASGTQAPSGTGTGSWAFVGAAAGTATNAGTGTGSWAYAGTAAGTGHGPADFRDITLTATGPTQTTTWAGTGPVGSSHQGSGPVGNTLTATGPRS